MAARDATESIEQLLQSLEHLDHGALEGKNSDLSFLRSMLTTPEFHSLLDAHNAVSVITKDNAPRPHSPDTVTLSNMISYDAEMGLTNEEQELFELLSSPHISALITTHDKVANKEYPLHSAVAMDTESGSVLEKGAPVRVVRIEKRGEPLGATVRRDKEGTILISRVLHGGMASRSGMLHPGDIVHEVSGTSVEGWDIDRIAAHIKKLTGTLSFKITPAMDEFTPKKRKELFHIRSLVSYDPDEDPNHPCKEAGLAYDRGTILQVQEREDPEWWQAKVDGGEMVGLIPSKKRMESLIAQSESSLPKKAKSKAKEYNLSNVLGREMITYEEMTKIEPQRERPRPIMLIAPRNGPFSLNELKQKLLAKKSSIFGSPIPHTSRPIKRGEEKGEAFHFIQRSQMEKAILNGDMVEHAFFNGHYYGTSSNSVQAITNSGKTCLLILDPQTIKLVRNSDLRPFIVYLTTPTAEFMKSHWVPNKKIKDSAVLDIIRQATHLEKNYGHYFDHYISFENLDSVYNDIVDLTVSLRTNMQWVPSSWIQ